MEEVEALKDAKEITEGVLEETEKRLREERDLKDVR